MRAGQQVVESFVTLPDPGRASTLDDLVERLRALKVWAGDPSYENIKDRVNAAWTEAGRPAGELVGKTTVVDCFRPGRRRLKIDLVVAVVRALHPDPGYVTQWQQVLQVVGGETRAAAQVRVLAGLPPDLAGFTGRTAEMDELRRALCAEGGDGGSDDVPTVFAIAGMAGVGKTQLAIRAGHLLARGRPFDRVLFVDLRGFHPDPVQPPADPAAVLDGFLRLLGMPGQRVPHDLPARVTAYRARLTGSRTLVILDNAADADQVRPLLPATPNCPVLVTSRRRLTGLPSATQLTVDVFTPYEAVVFLTRAAPGTPVGPDPGAPARIAQRCGHLPLALGLVAAHIRGTPGWTLTDHAERLDERHHEGRLEAGIELALDLSYRHLSGEERRLLRLAAAHPGQDLDGYAAAALTATDPATARRRLDRLCADHLLEQGASGRYGFHDLVRGYALGRSRDEDPPADRRDALTRLFDFYLATCAAATQILAPAEVVAAPPTGPIPTAPIPSVSVPSTSVLAGPVLAGPEAARAWLDTERPTLVAVAGYAARNGWPGHSIRLSSILFRYLDGGQHADALAVHGYARQAARRCGDVREEAWALAHLGAAELRLRRYAPGAEHLRQALRLFQEIGDQSGETWTLNVQLGCRRSG
ncbi:NB-ARC domain-containing protein [Plantactinospora sp. WMMB782]|uniref:NB-ARC domain-containing protein n=1 Tax=Plantactinospora sp. WMMB782 TaxID=3404121 RepID=UPI003B93A576